MAIACEDASNHFHKRCVAKSGGEVEQVDVAALQVGTGEREERERRERGRSHEVVTPSKVKKHTERQLMLLPFRKRVVLL